MAKTYFMVSRDRNRVRVGYDDSRRIETHEREGNWDFWAAFPCVSKDFEMRIHKYFEPYLCKDTPKSDSIYEGHKIFEYVEWLVRSGLVATEKNKVSNITKVPWAVLSPERVRAWDDHGQGSFLKPPLPKRKGGEAAHAYHASLSDEWYTPAIIIESARKVLGTIDLDPASCTTANEVVKATHFYSQAVDGLNIMHPWQGKLWMNPPYGGLASKFTVRLVKELRQGVTEAIALYNQNSMTSKWFDNVYDNASAYLMTRGRLAFRAGDDDQAFSSASTGSVIVYFGKNIPGFIKEFKQHGNILVPYVGAI